MSYKRKQEDNRRLKNLYEETKHSFGAGAYLDDRKNRFIRYTCHNEWFKTETRRITRRKLKQNLEIPQRNLYKKYYDYWWNIL